MAVVQGGTLTKETIPLPGGETAVYNASGLNFIRHTDWLGSSRLATTWAHAVYSKEAYAPFGETYNEAGTPDRSFTGQDQDTVTGSTGTGIYDFLFRKYDPAAGRWLSPDPAGWSVVNQSDPQSFNRYAFVENNPMSYTDLYGLDGGCGIFVSSDCEWNDWSDPPNIGESYTDGKNTYTFDGNNWVSQNGVIYSNEAAAEVGLPVGGYDYGFIIGQFIVAPYITPTPAPNNGQTKCTGSGRGLAGNTRLVGRQGGIPGQTIQLGTTAVIPQQFGVSSGTALGPYASSIYGTIGNASFSGITDVMGGKSPIPGVNVRTAMQQLFPGQLILEIPGATDQGANAAVTIFVAQGLGCPTGTSAAGGN